MKYLIIYRDASGNECAHETVFTDQEHARQVAKLFKAHNPKKVFAWAVHTLGTQLIK